MKRFLSGLFASISSYSAIAQTSDAAPAATASSGASGDIYWTLLLIAFGATIFILLIVSVTLLRTFQRVSKEFINPTPVVPQEPQRMLEYDEWTQKDKSKPGIWSKLLSLKPIEEEKDLVMEHTFDGITELNNPTPAWFNWLFYGTIAIGIAYLLHYHVFDWGKLQDAEYATEVEQAEAAKRAFLAKSGNKIDENTVKESTAAAEIASGQAVFNTNCIACHGDKGQGMVGPNLTDEYWLHGGTIKDVFKTVKYGVPEKGMIAWGKSLSPKQIADVSNFIKSLKGTNPAGAKAPQGNKEG